MFLMLFLMVKTRKFLWEIAPAIQDGGHKRRQPPSFGDRYLRYTA